MGNLGYQFTSRIATSKMLNEEVFYDQGMFVNREAHAVYGVELL